MIVLLGFGLVAGRLEHRALLMQLDDDIERRLSVIEAAIRIVTQRAPVTPPPPPGIPKPERIPGVPHVRIRDGLRERYWFTPRGECALVGQPMGFIAEETGRLSWQLTATGGVVPALGLAGGWWVSGRALRPIRDISNVA